MADEVARPGPGASNRAFGQAHDALLPIGVEGRLRALRGQIELNVLEAPAPLAEKGKLRLDGSALAETALPYAMLPNGFVLAPSISLDEIDDLLERRARREEIAGG